MITTVNKANKGLYIQLFEQVSEWLNTHNQDGEPIDDPNVEDRTPILGPVLDPETNEPMIDSETNEPILEKITSLEELFEYMRYLSRMGMFTDEEPIYTRLPLDEEPFFINGNTREISVPKVFATNGISVQGDEISEILFFKVNRFFDAADLNECDIFIQWKTSEVDGNGNFKEGVSRPWIKDIISEPGYLIFGWPISSKITKEAGAVTFSVRFYRLNAAEKLIYSFSTLDQTVKIQPALDYDIENVGTDVSKVVLDDMKADIILRAINSPNTSGLTSAEDPTWEPGIEDAIYNKTYANVLKTDGETIKYKLMNLDVDENGFSIVPVKLYTAALSEDSGVISYGWEKVDGHTGEGDLYLSDGVTNFYKPIAYRETQVTDATRIINKIYYIQQDENKYVPIPPATESNPTPIADLLETDENLKIYELVSVATIDEIGQYVGTARNRVGKVFSNELATNIIYVPSPAVPELGQLRVPGQTHAVLDENEISLALNVTLKDEFGNRVDNLGENKPGAKATYTWYRKELGGQDFDTIENTDATLTLDPEAEDQEGWYKVTVTNNLNKETAEDTSNEIRVTKPAVKPSLSIESKERVSLESAQQNKIHVYVNGLEPHREEEDTVLYQWYKYIPNGADADIDEEAARNGQYTYNGDVSIDNLNVGDLLTEEVLASALEDAFIPPVSGTYYCMVTNVYNGTRETKISPFYTIVA